MGKCFCQAELVEELMSKVAIACHSEFFEELISKVIKLN